MKNLGSITDDKSILTKGYGDGTYAPKSEVATLTEQVRVANLLASESDFKAEANFRAFKYGFDYLCIEDFQDTNDIDTTLLDGVTVINNYFDAANHSINKTSTDTLEIVSRKFELDNTPYDALIYLDYEGTGTVNLYFSKNDGTDWTEVPNDTLVSLNKLVQKNVRVKIRMVGKVTIQNIAWGCK